MKDVFNIGATVVSDDKRSVLFRRDCIVTYATPTMFAIVTEGMSQVFFFDKSEGFHEAKPGIGSLDENQLNLLRAVVSEWSFSEILCKFPDVIEEEMKGLGCDLSDNEGVTITATVPKKLAFYWSQMIAALHLSRSVHSHIPQDAEKLLVQWAMLSTAKIEASVRAPDIMQQVFGNRGRKG